MVKHIECFFQAQEDHCTKLAIIKLFIEFFQHDLTASISGMVLPEPELCSTGLNSAQDRMSTVCELSALLSLIL